MSMTSDHYVSSNNSFKSHLNAKSSTQYFASAFTLRVMRAYKGDGNSASGKNWKELSSSKISTEGSFNGDSNEETLNVKKRTCWQ